MGIIGIWAIIASQHRVSAIKFFRKAVERDSEAAVSCEKAAIIMRDALIIGGGLAGLFTANTC